MKLHKSVIERGAQIIAEAIDMHGKKKYSAKEVALVILERIEDLGKLAVAVRKELQKRGKL